MTLIRPFLLRRAWLIALIVLVGCGQSGALYLPDPEPAAPVTEPVSTVPVQAAPTGSEEDADADSPSAAGPTSVPKTDE